MGRQRRAYLPGGIFHVTARTIRGERWFTPRLRTAALRTLADVWPRSGARLLAVAIMSNHFHVVIQQGERPLSALMHPALQRLALLLHREHGLEGPVFWRPYAAAPCLDPKHARNAIVYTHLNPVRAGLCHDPDAYPWTTHSVYAGGSDDDLPWQLGALDGTLDPLVALPLFASGPVRSPDRLHADYRAFVARRLKSNDALDGSHHERDAGPAGEPPASLPAHTWGNLAWSASFSPLFHSPAGRTPATGGAAGAPDLATIARVILGSEAPGLTVDAIRGRGGGLERSRVRRLVVRRMHAAGYRNIQIARFLNLSESAVSYFVCAGWRGE